MYDNEKARLAAEIARDFIIAAWGAGPGIGDASEVEARAVRMAEMFSVVRDALIDRIEPADSQPESADFVGIVGE